MEILLSYKYYIGSYGYMKPDKINLVKVIFGYYFIPEARSGNFYSKRWHNANEAKVFINSNNNRI